MIVKVKNVYYCEYCKKRNFHKPRMIKHEKHCTLNPNRECGLCGEGEGFIKNIIKKYKKTFKIIEEKIDNDTVSGTFEKVKWLKKITLKDIRKDVAFCPMCTFAVLQCTGMIHHPVRNEECLKLEDNFDFKQECKEWWLEHNEPSPYDYY